MTVLADLIAACIASTLVPSEQNPCRSGGVALTSLTNRLALADMRTTFRSSYGAPVRSVDQLGRNVLAVPPDFSYVTFGEIGSPMSDGAPTPLALDGMAAFRGPCGTVRLIRNHEDRNAIGHGSVRYPYTQNMWKVYRGVDKDVKDGGNQIEYGDQDPRVHQIFRDELARKGIASRMRAFAEAE